MTKSKSFWKITRNTKEKTGLRIASINSQLDQSGFRWSNYRKLMCLHAKHVFSNQFGCYLSFNCVITEKCVFFDNDPNMHPFLMYT